MYSDKTMKLWKPEIGINHIIGLNHDMKLETTRKDVRGVEACATDISRL